MLFIRLFCAALVGAFSLVSFGALLGLGEATIILTVLFSIGNFIFTASATRY